MPRSCYPTIAFRYSGDALLIWYCFHGRPGWPVRNNVGTLVGTSWGSPWWSASRATPCCCSSAFGRPSLRLSNDKKLSKIHTRVQQSGARLPNSLLWIFYFFLWWIWRHSHWSIFAYQGYIDAILLPSLNSPPWYVFQNLFLCGLSRTMILAPNTLRCPTEGFLPAHTSKGVISGSVDASARFIKY